MMLILLLFVMISIAVVYMMIPEKGTLDSCRDWIGRGYAEGGLHPEYGDTAAYTENAVAMAARQGYAISIPVRLSSDNQLVIYPDALLTLCGSGETVRSCTAEKLQSMTYGESGQSIAALSQALAVVDGKVPLVLEIPAGKQSSAIIAAVCTSMENYIGTWAVSSYDPAVLRYARHHAPKAKRIQKTGKPAQLSMLPAWQRLPASLCLWNCAAMPHMLYVEDRNASWPPYRYLCNQFRVIPAGGLAYDKETFGEMRRRYGMLFFVDCLPQSHYDYVIVPKKKENAHPVSGKPGKGR